MKKRPTISPALIYLLLVGIGFMNVGRSGAAIIFPEPPPECRAAATQEAISTFPSDFLKNGQVKTLKATLAYHCYLLDNKSVLAGKMFEKMSRLDDWCFMVMGGTNMVEEIRLGLNKKKQWAFDAAFPTMKPPHVVWMAYEVAEKLPQIKNQDYEFRFVMVDLNFWGVWLHGKTDDIIIPTLAPPYDPWQAFHPYSASEMSKLLEKMQNGMGGGKFP